MTIILVSFCAGNMGTQTAALLLWLTVITAPVLTQVSKENFIKMRTYKNVRSERTQNLLKCSRDH